MGVKLDGTIHSEDVQPFDTCIKVLAGPGAGKTHWLIGQIKHVLSESNDLGLSRKVGCITYTSKGELDYDDTVYDSRWFDRRDLNLTNAWITLVRRIWYKVAKSAYSDMDVEKARTDKELRQNIIDDIDSNNEIASWNESDPAWNLFAEYNWFYGYYTSGL